MSDTCQAPAAADPHLAAYASIGSDALYVGDCRIVLPQLTDARGGPLADSIVTDPPYDLTAGKKGGRGVASVTPKTPHGRSRIGTGNGGGFMGLDWDATGVAFDPETWAAALAALKPGGHLVAFGGTRTWHRMAVAIEDAGFEIRDTLAWLYGSGFPKSLDVLKAIDRALVRRAAAGLYAALRPRGARPRAGRPCREARAWDGWGTALKPAHEPIILARKPLQGTVAANVLEHGTGALNIDGCRVAIGDEALGRWPANVVLGCACEVEHDPGCAVRLLDEQSGERPANTPRLNRRGANTGTSIGGLGRYGTAAPHSVVTGYGDSGGASRFFYTAKASRSERTARGAVDNDHATVKPLDLMRWLVRLVTPRGGVVLDPFAGSGTTWCAALAEGVGFLGVELLPEHAAVAISRAREHAGPLFAVGGGA